MRGSTWEARDAEDYLASLEPVGWKLGLERMHRLTTLLGMPQHRFASIHVVGTNGKSSVARMTMALLGAHGLRTGACVSPHLHWWAERILIDGAEIEPGAFAAAVERTAEAAGTVDRTLEDGENVTQFEVATAAAFVALAAARVQAGVIEAGLGGRLDATNVIPSKVTVLTSIGLDHTEWLGGTVEEIAAEKLAVLRDGSTLVLGDVAAPVREIAFRAADRHGARVLEPSPDGTPIRLRAPGEFQRRNFALAAAAAAAFHGPLDPGKVRAVAADVVVPARLERLPGDPPTLLDAAHNPDGAAALAEALPEASGGRPVMACIGVLAEKDAEGILRALAPEVAHVTTTELPPGALRGRGRPGASFHPAARLAGICEELGVPVTAVPDSARAIAATRARAAAEGGVALLTGSHYLLGLADGQAGADRGG